MCLMNNMQSLKPFLEPESVAIIGLSRKTGENHYNALENLLSYGYKGRIYPINPNAAEILGVKAYPSIKNVEDSVDLAVIVTPRSQVPVHVRNCAEKGVRCISIVTQGFTDAGDEDGKRLYKEIVEIADSTGCRILGPNTFGSANVFVNFSSSFARLHMQRNPVGLICQSGMLFNCVSEYRFVGKGIDVGNICNVDFSDCLEYFEQDPQVNVIVLHIEGMPDARKFFNAAQRITRKKPIIALKTARSQQAATAAHSHTGSLAGKNEIWEAALKQAGIIGVDSLEELVDITRTFCMLPLMKRPDIAVATFSGGTAIMALDGLRNSKLKIGKLSESTRTKIQKMAPDWLAIGNPLDYWPMVMGSDNRPRLMRDVMEALLADEGFGGIIFIQIVPTPEMGQEMGQLLTGLVTMYPRRPLIAAFTGPYNFECAKELQTEGRVLAFPTPERAARAFVRLYQYSELRRALCQG